MWIDIISYIGLGAAVIQILYWGVFFMRFALKTFPSIDLKQVDTPPVSVVICARNEAVNLSHNLPLILQQDYPKYEVVVVNDGSTDASGSILADLSKTYGHLRIINIKPEEKRSLGKKQALSNGIKATNYDILLLTDADCSPKNRHWIYKLQALIRKEKQIVLGYGPYKMEASWLNAFIRFETIYTAIQYYACALWGMPYMGVGRNLAYHKSLFAKTSGFVKHQHVMSGDDDLFINEVADSNNTAIVLDRSTFMYSSGKKSWGAYYQQKRRHLSTSIHYKIQHKIILGILSMSHLLLYCAIPFVLVFHLGNVFTMLFFFRFVLLWLVYGLVAKKLQEKHLFWKIPLLDVIYVLYYIVFLHTLLIGNTKQWQQRNLKIMK